MDEGGGKQQVIEICERKHCSDLEIRNPTMQTETCATSELHKTEILSIYLHPPAPPPPPLPLRHCIAGLTKSVTIQYSKTRIHFQTTLNGTHNSHICTHAQMHASMNVYIHDIKKAAKHSF